MVAKNFIKIATCVVFVACLIVGFREARMKKIWVDEVYTNLHSVYGRSYMQILEGRGTLEGNSNPLFYLIQKIVIDIAYAVNPAGWINDSKETDHPDSRIILRLWPVCLMSAGIALIFYYFASRYSIGWGIYSLVISFSSFMVWSYWAESRPYALWFFLTAAQWMFWLDILKSKKPAPNGAWMYLTVTHILLALTITLSMIQIAIASAILMIWVKPGWRKILSVFIPAFFISSYYYWVAPKYVFWFKEGPLDLINASLSKDRMVILGLFVGYWVVSWIVSHQKKVGQFWRENCLQNEALRHTGATTGFIVLLLAVNFGLLQMLFLKQPTDGQGFQMSNRYFMSLAPVGIMTVTLCSIYFFKTPRSWIVKSVFIFVIGGIVFMRFARAYGLFPVPF